MFFITAKVSKKKIIYTLLVFLAAAAIIIFLPRSGGGQKAPAAETREQRVELLSQFGWTVDPVSEDIQNIFIPEDFPDTYVQYNKLQQQSGFNLEEYTGRDAARYSYQVLNYPDYEDPVYADLLVCDGVLIGGDIHSLSLDGFMVGLR